jgi:hypothetical protein
MRHQPKNIPQRPSKKQITHRDDGWAHGFYGLRRDLELNRWPGYSEAYAAGDRRRRSLSIPSLLDA